jgi:hypothetical protein
MKVSIGKLALNTHFISQCVMPMMYAPIADDEVNSSPLTNPLVSDGDPEDIGARSMNEEELQRHYEKVMMNACESEQEVAMPPLLLISKIAEWFDVPLSPYLFFTIRGAENFHIYLWIAKDICWTLGNFHGSLGFGLAAIAWCGVLMYHAVTLRNYEEAYFMFPLTLWLFANFWWMTSDFVVNGGDGDREKQAGYIMFAGAAFFVMYWAVLRPYNVLTTNVNTARKYNDVGLTPRWSVFRSWRQYEHFHTMCWLGKDAAWNHYSGPPWIIFAIPTIYISLDFIWEASKNKGLVIDSAHYMAQLLWVFGNMAWAYGEIYRDSLDGDAPHSLWDL